MGTQDTAQRSAATGDSTAINNSPTVTQRHPDPELDTSGFRDNEENKEIVSNISTRQHIQ